MDSYLDKSQMDLSLIQEMLLIEIDIVDERLKVLYSNKIKSLELQANKQKQSLKQIGLLMLRMKLTVPEIDKKARDSFLLSADTLEERINYFALCVINLLPEYDGEKIVPQQTLREFIMKDKTKKEYFCNDCSASFIELRRLQRHINNKHRFTVPCSICKICFEDELMAWVHEQIIHTNIYTTLRCVYCKVQLSDSKGLRRHVLKQHNQQIRSDFHRVMQRWPQDQPHHDYLENDDDDQE